MTLPNFAPTSPSAQTLTTGTAEPNTHHASPARPGLSTQVTEKSSKPAIPRVPVQPLAAVMKTPMSWVSATPPGVAVPTLVQETPSGLHSPVYVSPKRVSRRYTGAVREPAGSMESNRPLPSESQDSAQPL